MTAGNRKTGPDEEDAHDPWLLVSDVDDTLLGHDPSLRQLLRVLGDSPAVRLAINSSRPYASVRRTFDACPVPVRPHAWINAMGTEIRIGDRLLESWHRRFADFDRRPIDALMRQRGHTPHAPEFQTPLKASFVVPMPEQADAISQLFSLDVPLQVITSGRSDFDVIPAAADKGRATLALAAELGVALEHLIVAGDSANDMAMFEVAQRSIVVGNARPELRDVVDPARAYLATAHHAAGILEGLRRHGAPLIERKQGENLS